jgi:PAS domain S-box-containing protein
MRQGRQTAADAAAAPQCRETRQTASAAWLCLGLALGAGGATVLYRLGGPLPAPSWPAVAGLAAALAAGGAAWLVAPRRRQFGWPRRPDLGDPQLIDALPDAIAVFDRRARVQAWNAQAARLFGYTPEEVVGRPLPTLPEGMQPAFFAGLERLAGGDAPDGLKYAGRRRSKRGELLDLSLSLLPLRDRRGRLRAFVEIACDIRSCPQLVCKLQQAEKMSGIGQLAAGVAHQLNTPLGSALLRAQMLEEDLHHPEQVEDLRFIQRQLQYGKEIVESLLRFSRPSGERKRAESLNVILQGVLSMLPPTLRGAKVQVALEVAATEGALVYVARNELEQVFFNLCSNALDAMPQGGTLTLATRRRGERWVEVRVADTGIGIPPARLPRIFEPFYTTKEPGKGTGLGLAICRRIVEEAGGSIEVASTPGWGTTFTVRLPLVGLEPAARSGPAATPSAGKSGSDGDV